MSDSSCGRTRNSDHRRLGVNLTVESLLAAIADNDRWSIARRSTGPLLRDLLNAGAAGAHLHSGPLGARYIALGGHPLTAVDDGVAILIGVVTGLATPGELPITAVLIRRDESARHWLVASLDVGRPTPTDVRHAVVRGTLSEPDDLEIIGAAAPLDARAAAFDWDDPATILRNFDDRPPHTVADMHLDLAEFGRAAWPWLADEAPSFAGLFLRATHPNLVRDFDEE